MERTSEATELACLTSGDSSLSQYHLSDLSELDVRDPEALSRLNIGQ